MMRNFCFLFIVMALSTFGVMGQACQPEWTLPGSGISPDTTENLPVGYVNQNYEAVAQFKVPQKAPFNGDSIAIDHIELSNVTGLDAIPASTPFVFQCNPVDCSFAADSVGCVLISGVPTTPGIYSLIINVYVWITPFVFIPFPTPGYELVVYQNVGIPALSSSMFDVSVNTPNPFSERSVTYVNLQQPAICRLVITDVFGIEKHKSSFSGKQGVNEVELDAAALAPGMYFFMVTDGVQAITRKMSVQE